MAPSGGLFDSPVLTIIVVMVAILAAWAILRLVARLVAAAIVVGLLLYGLASLVGQWTNQSPQGVMQSAIATVTAEATRTAREAPAAEDFGRLDRPRGTPPAASSEDQPSTQP